MSLSFVSCRFSGPFDYAFVLSFKLRFFNWICTVLLVCEQTTMCISQKVKFIDIRMGNFLQLYLLKLLDIYEPRHDKMCLREFPTRPDTNRSAQPQKLAKVYRI